ncbi:LysR family transcriptional regulator [Parasedimentitalea psychrophila]|uniref:LysR family transcriptional regulator n=1 Tax=Parasedimentitalea psychrophila TaxID=2997337 RepID=A0A9Y2P607_9RHOB|nr:LysR family transcriptional regulator [Parasedimentitalea psychrophila]WIY24513.1 LysR family transcriptional regulator [Parasedimentitalea psychrophila]
MTNLDHLNVVSTICDVGSFQLASEKLNKARSAVSYSVKQVEEFYQIQIFDRSKYRPELTADGKILLVQIRYLLKQAQNFEDFVHELKGENEVELRLGVSSHFPLEKLTGLLKSLKADFPTTTIHLEMEIASGERILQEEKVDIAIFGAPSQSVFIDYQQIDSMNVPLVISSDLIENDPAKISETDLARHPQVIVKSTDEKSPDVGILDDALKWYVTDLHAKKALICAGLGWGRLPHHFAEPEISNGKLVVLSTLGDLSLPIYLTKLANRSLGPVGKRIWEYFL